MIDSLKPDTKAMEMSLQEYCSWYFHNDELTNIFGLGLSVLPPIAEILEHAVSVEGYDHPSLYAMLVDESVGKEDLLKLAKELNLDLSFPSLKQTAITVCRWVISQEPVITKNLDQAKRDAIVGSSEDYGYMESVFAPLTRAFSFGSDNETIYSCYFCQLYGDKDSQGPLFKKIMGDIAALNIPDEYLEIYRLLLDFYGNNCKVAEWIENEAKIVDLAKIVYQKLTA